MRGIAIASFGALLGGLLLFGAALVVARPAQATTDGCMDPLWAGELAICEIGMSIAWGDTEATFDKVAKKLYQACRRVGDAQVKCINRARTKLKGAGKKGCRDFEGSERELCLDYLAEELYELGYIIDWAQDELKGFCEYAAEEWWDDPEGFCSDMPY